MAGYADAFTMGPSETLAGLIADQDAAARETEAALGSLDLGRPVPVPRGVPWFPADVDAWSVRWVLLHLIQETARHAGHADIVRESIDGATAYELMAAAEGWPATDWLKPWRPPTAADAPDTPAHRRHRGTGGPAAPGAQLGRPGRLQHRMAAGTADPRATRPTRTARSPHERGADAGPGCRRCCGHGCGRRPRHQPRVGVVPLAGQTAVATSPAGLPAGVDAALRPHRLRHRPDAGVRA